VEGLISGLLVECMKKKAPDESVLIHPVPFVCRAGQLK
jgi:hypothetical protein